MTYTAPKVRFNHRQDEYGPHCTHYFTVSIDGREFEAFHTAPDGHGLWTHGQQVADLGQFVAGHYPLRRFKKWYGGLVISDNARDAALCRAGM